MQPTYTVDVSQKELILLNFFVIVCCSNKGANIINFKIFRYYDSVYPSQDVANAIGNLIALHLQGQALKIRRIMDEKGSSVKEVQEYLGLRSVQSVYHWLNGISMPMIDNLDALSDLIGRF